MCIAVITLAAKRKRQNFSTAGVTEKCNRTVSDFQVYIFYWMKKEQSPYRSCCNSSPYCVSPCQTVSSTSLRGSVKSHSDTHLCSSRCFCVKFLNPIVTHTKWQTVVSASIKSKLSSILLFSCGVRPPYTFWPHFTCCSVNNLNEFVMFYVR